eukprot:2683990-Pleurochrysis_carterae.AAC.1
MHPDAPFPTDGESVPCAPTPARVDQPPYPVIAADPRARRFAPKRGHRKHALLRAVCLLRLRQCAQPFIYIACRRAGRRAAVETAVTCTIPVQLFRVTIARYCVALVDIQWLL